MKLSISREIYKAYFALVKVLSIANQKGSRFGFPLPFLGVGWAGAVCNDIAAYLTDLTYGYEEDRLLAEPGAFLFHADDLCRALSRLACLRRCLLVSGEGFCHFSDFRLCSLLILLLSQCDLM